MMNIPFIKNDVGAPLSIFFVSQFGILNCDDALVIW